MLAGPGTRPVKPAHALTPPSVDHSPFDPSYAEEPVDPPRWTEAPPRLGRNEKLHQADAYLTIV
jgi:hypothetical protein